MSGCGAEIVANALLIALEDPTDPGFVIPDITGPQYQIPVAQTGPLYDSITRLSNSHLTERSLTGNGTFDALMAGFNVHLAREFENGRITGEQYSKAYVELTQAAMNNAVQYLLGKEQAYWQALAAQQQARVAEAQIITARIEAESSKVKLQVLRYEAATQKTVYATNKMQLAIADVAFCTANYNLDNMLPKQLAQVEKNNLLLDNQIAMFSLQQITVREQGESIRAQTLDTRTDGAPVSGVLGKQRQLYDQQITSYRRDAENKAAKLFTDAWITMKTIDEGVLPPTGFTNSNLDVILNRIKINNDLGV